VNSPEAFSLPSEQPPRIEFNRHAFLVCLACHTTRNRRQRLPEHPGSVARCVAKLARSFESTPGFPTNFKGLTLLETNKNRRAPGQGITRQLSGESSK